MLSAQWTLHTSTQLGNKIKSAKDLLYKLQRHSQKHCRRKLTTIKILNSITRKEKLTFKILLKERKKKNSFKQKTATTKKYEYYLFSYYILYVYLKNNNDFILLNNKQYK